MILSDIKYKRYKFNFNRHFSSSKQSIKQKEIIIISSKDPSGKIHYGEVGPLEGFSNDNIEACNSMLDNFLSKVDFIDGINYQNIISEFIEFPALYFGFEQLILSLNLKNGKIDLPSKRININGVVGLEESKTALDQVADLAERYFSTVKLKVGRNSFDEDLLFIESIYSKFGERIKLRLDNNGKWNYNDAELYLKELVKFNIEYIEQPVADLDELMELSKFSKVPVAADDSIDNFEQAEKVIRNSNINFLVLKPSIRIGIFDTYRIIELAEQFNTNVIISSAFETAIGRLTLLYLSALNNHDFAHGLNTELIGENYYKSAINYNSPVISLNKKDLIPHFDLEL